MREGERKTHLKEGDWETCESPPLELDPQQIEFDEDGPIHSLGGGKIKIAKEVNT